MAQRDRFAELLSQLAREVTRRQATEVCCGDLTQAAGAASATALFRWLLPNLPTLAERVIARGDKEDAA
jgi:hypothetical protein